MPSAADDIRAALAASATGSVSFRDFMTIALYGDHGFYSAGGRAGRRGDFLTSAEVGPLFGTVVARWIDRQWRDQGSPSDFQVVEVGAGPGTLARSVLAASPSCLERGSYVAVETSTAQRQSHPAGIESRADMPERIANGVVIANELLDNMPFDLWVFDETWRMAHVIDNGDAFAEVLVTEQVPACLPGRAPHGARAPVQVDASRWLADTLARFENGSVLAFDYCTALTAEVASMPWREWLRTYVAHERGGHYLRSPGTQDITSQVCIDQLSVVKEPHAVRSQSQFLKLWGIDELVEEGRRAWQEAAASPTLEAMKMRSRISESEALLDMSGLGAFTAVEWRTNRASAVSGSRGDW